MTDHGRNPPEHRAVAREGEAHHAEAVLQRREDLPPRLLHVGPEERALPAVEGGNAGESSSTIYDSQTRSQLDTPQRFPRVGSQSYPSPAAEPNADGSSTVYFAPEQPQGVARGNWIQTIPGRGWFVMLRLYGPLEPFFDKTWRLGEIESVL